MKHEEQIELLDKYRNHKLNLTPTMNIHQFEIFNELGKYFYDIIKGLEHPIITEYEPILKPYKKQGIFTKKDDYSHITIFFLTSFLDEKSLKQLYGKPIKHSYFGEGFEKKRKYNYISYMVKINDIIFHIGIDHRGTCIECEYNASVDDLNKCFKSLMNLYIEIILCL